jgi:DNA-binding transcriptional MerR regulator
MKISEVIELTGLTKKAINYYEEEGLIIPEINSENNYREYNHEVIDMLVQISVLRQFNVPIKDIKNIISKPERLKDTLEQHLKRLSVEMQKLEKSKSILHSCLISLDHSTVGLSQFTKQLSTLNKSIEMDERSREGFMKRQLQLIFPGNFGRLLIVALNPFFNEAVDTREKEEAWLNLVCLLDEAESLEYSEEFEKMYEKMADGEMEKYESFLYKDVKKYIEITDEEFIEEKMRILEYVNDKNNNIFIHSLQEKLLMQTNGGKNEVEIKNYLEKFEEQLKILSSDFKKYTNRKTEYYNFFSSIIK